MTRAWQHKKVTRECRVWSMADIQLTDLGNRWVAGETIQALAREAGVKVSTLYYRLLKAGFSLAPEEASRRVGGKSGWVEGYGGRLLSDADYERFRTREMDRAESMWSAVPKNAFQDASDVRDQPGRLRRVVTHVSQSSSIDFA